MNRMSPVRVPLFAVLTLLPAFPLAAAEDGSPPGATAQELLEKPARLEVKDVTIAEALIALRETAEVNIVFSPTLLPERRVSCTCSGATVEQALQRILDGTGFGLVEMQHQIVLRPPETPRWQRQVALSAPPTTFANITATRSPNLARPVQTPALQDTVSGIVVSAETGLPLANAVVSVTGSDMGALTDTDGRFRIVGVENLASITLQASLIGYATASVTVANGAEDIRIPLEQTAVSLDAVVVSALGIDRDRRALGYSVATVGADELTVNRSPNLGDALQGKMPGVNVTALGTGPQGSSKIRIRGQSSFGGNNSPLLVVNGIPIDNTSFGVSGDFSERGSNRNSDSGDGLSSINPDDVVNISVLKGAAAAALYGSRAKDGVIMITTRNRAVGTGIQWEFTSNATTEQPLDFRDYQMLYGQGEGGVRPSGELLPGSGQWSFGERFQPGMTQVLFDGVEVPYVPQPNQFDQYYRNGSNISNTITVANGSENGGVSASLSDLRSQAILPGSDYTRQTVNVGFTQQVAERYTISGNVNYSHEDRDNPANIAEQDYSPVVIYSMATSMPMDLLREKAFTEEGDEMFWSRFTNRTNPYFALSRFENNIRDRVFGNITGRMELTDWMYVQGRIGQDYYNREQEYNLPTGSTRQPPAPPGFVNGQYVQDQLIMRELNADVLLGAQGQFGDIGLSANAGGNVMRRSSERSNVLAQDFYTRGSYTLGNARLLSPEYGKNERQVNSLYGSAEASYRELFFLMATVRNDWFSTLSAENRSILYPSISASLVVSEAMSLPSWVTFGKVRAAYAEVGSDTDVPPYSDNLFYTISPNLFLNQPLGQISGGVVPNPNLRPMRLSEWEMGLETTLFNNLTLDIGYYQRVSEDQILNQQVSTASGFSTRRINIGKSRNRGLEWLVDFSPIRTDRFTWRTTYNGSYNQSRVLDLGSEVGVDEITVGEADFHGELRQVIGKPLNQLYGWGWLRDEQGRRVFNPTNGLPLRSEEQLNYGSALPIWVGGISNRFEFGDLSASFLIDYKLGHKLVSGTHINAYRHGLDKATLPGREEGCVVGEGVLPDGSPNTICAPVQSFYESIRTQRTSEQSVFNAGSWQLRQIAIGYDLMHFIPEGSRIRGLRLDAVANNVLVLKKWVPHIHPDQNGIISDARMGLESTGLPVTRGIGLNLNVKF